MPDPEKVIEEVEKKLDSALSDAVKTGDKAVETGDKHKVIVSGEEREVTLAELKERYQKETAADEKFQKASGAVKEAERLREMSVVLKKAQAGDVAAIRRLPEFEELGLTGEQAEEVITMLDQQQREARRQEAGGNDKTPLSEFEDMPERVRKSIERQEAQDQQVTIDKVRDNLTNALDNDADLSMILRGKGSEGRKKRLGDYALGVLRAEVRKTGRYTPEAFKRAIAETHAYAKDLGLLDFPEDDSVPGSALGLSRAPASMSSRGLRKAGERPERIPVDEALNTETYAKNVVDRLHYDRMGRNE